MNNVMESEVLVPGASCGVVGTNLIVQIDRLLCQSEWEGDVYVCFWGEVPIIVARAALRADVSIGDPYNGAVTFDADCHGRVHFEKQPEVPINKSYLVPINKQSARDDMWWGIDKDRNRLTK